MPRKKTKPSTEAGIDSSVTTVAETPAEPAIAPIDTSNVARPDWIDGPPTDQPEPASQPIDGTSRNYGPPYKAVFTSNEKGFELGENRRFRQRVFTFKDKPAQDVIDKLKQNGFTYRPAEKAWTAPATAESRVLTDRLARELAGQEQAIGRE